MTNQPHREFLYRMAYEMGRHPIGYEVQKVLAAVDWFAKHGRDADRSLRLRRRRPAGPVRRGAGPRIRVAVVEGAFAPREETWKEPIDRNVFGLLREFGDAELAAYLFLAATEPPLGPRVHALIVENVPGPTWDGPPAAVARRSGAAPGSLAPLDGEAVDEELARARKLVERNPADSWVIVHGPHEDDVLAGLSNSKLRPAGDPPTDLRKDFHPKEREHRQFDQLIAFTQKVLRECERSRDASFWSKLDTSSVEKYEASCAPFRRQLDEDVLGKLPDPTVPMNPRTRLLYDEPKYRAYEVMLDIYPDVFAYGILAAAQGPQARREAAGRRLPARPGGPADRRDMSQEGLQLLPFLRLAPGRVGLHRLRPAEPVHRRRQVPLPPAQGQPPWAVAVLVHRPPAFDDARLADDAAQRGRRAASPFTASPMAARPPCACRP